MKVARRAGGSEFGGVMVIALIVALVVTGLGMSFLQVNLAITKRMGQSAHDKRAFYIAEAGLAEAYWGLSVGKTGRIGSAAAPAAFGNGLFWVEAIEQADGMLRLESTGMYGRGRATVSLTVEELSPYAHASGLVALLELDIHPATLIDGYDSSLGSYASQADLFAKPPHTDGGAVVRSNGDVTIAGSKAKSTTIYGDVIAGPASAVTTGSNATVTGETSTATSDLLLAPVNLPSIPQAGALEHGSMLPKILPAGEHGFTELSVSSRALLVLQGPMTLLVDELVLDSRAMLLLDDTNGPIEIFVRDSIALNSASVMTSLTRNPANVTVHVAADDTGGGSDSIFLAADTEFYGTINGPKASAYLSNDFELFGGLVVAEATLSEGVRIHLDAALAAAAEVNETPQTLTWRIVAVPAAVAGKRADPWSIVGADASAAGTPFESHGAVWVRLAWAGLPGGTYEGWDADFDMDSIDGALLMYQSWTGPDKQEPLKASLLGL